MKNILLQMRNLGFVSAVALFLVSCGPSEEKKEWLLTTNYLIKDYVGGVSFDFQYGELSKDREAKQKKYNSIIKRLHSEQKIFSSSADILKDLTDEETILERWNRVATETRGVTSTDYTQDIDKLTAIKIKFSHIIKRLRDKE